MEAPEMKTASEIVKAYPNLGLYEHTIKNFAREGKIISVKAGSRTYINVQSLFDLLNGKTARGTGVFGNTNK